MATDSDGMSYGEQVKQFAEKYCKTHTQKQLSEATGVPPNTLSKAMSQGKRPFGRITHNRIVGWLQSTARDLHSRGLPLMIDDIPLPLESSFLATLGISSGPAAEEQGRARAAEMPVGSSATDAPPTSGYGDSEAVAAVSGESVSAEEGSAEVLVPSGISLLRLEPDDQALELWNMPGMFEDDIVSADLKRTFAVSMGNLSDARERLNGWLQPVSPGEAADEETIDRIALLIREWLKHAQALEICEEVPRFVEHEAFRFTARRKLELEVILIEDFEMTHPNSETPWDRFQKHSELQQRYSRIEELQDVEYPSFLEVVLLGVVKLWKALWWLLSVPTAWVFNRIRLRRTRRTG